MKKHLYLLTLASLLIFGCLKSTSSSESFLTIDEINEGMPCPASCYAYMLGYPEELAKSSKGGGYGLVTLPNGQKVESWSFFRGLVGQEYSYCARKGFKTLSDTTLIYNGYIEVCTACIKLDSLNRIIEKVSLDSLMIRYGDELCKPMNGNK